MENKLEQLLNKLIEKGWKPYGKSIAELTETEKNVRLLTSLSSGLWQFVCENGYNQYKKEYRRGYTKHNTKAEYWDEGDYEYYLIESSLKDESELEDFLLNSISLHE